MSAWSKADSSACLSSDKKRASESIGRPRTTRYGQSVLDELDLLDILARGLAIQRELAADNLNDVGVAALSELLGGSRAERLEPSSTEHLTSSCFSR